jgi:hypothetical protein
MAISFDNVNRQPAPAIIPKMFLGFIRTFKIETIDQILDILRS